MRDVSACGTGREEPRSAVRREQLAILALERRDRQVKEIDDARSSIADRKELA